MKIAPDENGIYYATLQTNNGSKRFSLGTRDPVIAEEAARMANVTVVEAASKAGSLTLRMMRRLCPTSFVRVDLAIKQWVKYLEIICESRNSVANMGSPVRTWAKRMELGNKYVSDITEEDVAGFINAEDGTKYNTRKLRRKCLHHFFNWCMGTGREYCNTNPTQLVRIQMKLMSFAQKESRKGRPFTDEEYHRLLKFIERKIAATRLLNETFMRKRLIERLKFWLCAVIIGRNTALRLGDIANLERESLATPGKLIVWTDKRNTRVEFDISPSLFTGINMIPHHLSKLCFPEQAKVINNPDKRGQVSADFGRLLLEAGIKDHIYHDLRSTKATELYGSGKTVEEIAKFLGHSSPASTPTYLPTPQPQEIPK